MRLHRNLVFTVIDSLEAVFNEQEYADKVVQKALKKDPRWGARDRKFVAETFYEIVRWKRLYNEIAGTKDHYSRENLWKIFAVWAVLRGINLPDWKYFSETPVRRIKGKFDELQSNRAIAQSIPDWMDELCAKELGEKKWTAELTAQNIPASAILRVNTLRGSKKQLQDLLAKDEIITKPIKGYPCALELEERKNVFKTAAFQSGLFEMQDASSQLVAEFLEVEPGMRVVDTCAGAGGKTLHIAALMENKGSIIATDIYGGKLVELKKRAKRAGAFNITTKKIESSKTIKKLYNTADRVLIDAPCSGLGVLRRNPDSKWKLQPEFIDNIKDIQRDILERYSKIVKVGGKVVYATCSILPSENQEQVARFLGLNPNFKLIKDKKILASQSGYDGFYMALLERIE
ncbi:RsmB/NOP family class I SAM-dependent RNA methyltransferase [Wenyingzhuangia aestuarii]|uniref:RsmB/NOP family class I SAM-dependent RNA methyltransferase n=1 Tax=Wenyingzhuangia aestuarii TaxID=1647582 RepID=UPI001438C900|nr:class I SAM-dependent methyltransferase [Wenyingzhuangia aestuarii]NJB82301.1 16S rRNA (cytosine967-C5)-methyltransferase [Wenyingzhuangia aestuarii]